MGVGCLLDPATCAAGLVTHATLGDLFNALTNWVVESVHWILTSAGGVLATTTDPATVTNSVAPLYATLTTLSPILMLTGLMVATLSALRHGDAGSLWRAYLGVAPASVAAIALARPVAGLILRAVNDLSSAASASVLAREGVLADDLHNLVGTIPGFGLFLLAVAVVVGSWFLWCELVVRVVVLSLVLVLVPVVAALATFPSLRRVGWRLAETFVAVAASKFLIVIALVLGLDELTGTSATRVVAGAVTLALAALTPFVLLRVVPVIEQSALHHLEGVRQRATRGTRQAALSASRAGAMIAPDTPPAPPETPEDLGFDLWEGDGEVTLAPPYAGPVPAPVGEPQLRRGHVAYTKDHMGPVVTWHFDE
ncbi:MAG: hypothetical protein KGJ39_06660 [Acidobacteriota bacterium]|nr:hypothetical protein [Acidobacteriota bacterium]